MNVAVNRIAVLVAVFEDQFVLHPIAAHTFHTDAVTVVHQPFGEETRQVADAAYDVAAENVVRVAYMQHSIKSALVFNNFLGIHMHGERFRADLGDPSVAFMGTKVI